MISILNILFYHPVSEATPRSLMCITLNIVPDTSVIFVYGGYSFKTALHL